jgi:N-acetylglucosaminyldiphosphoundecaprenol N-acetyl-beta-D-mannosaminyltransferase
VLNLINEYQPDILYVGMGMPMQELWVKKNIHRINSKVIMLCGATIDYYSGFAKRAPEWLGKIGFEGVFRLLHDPKRLWRRYILEPIYILYRLVLWKIKKKSI